MRAGDCVLATVEAKMEYNQATNGSTLLSRIMRDAIRVVFRDAAKAILE